MGELKNKAQNGEMANHASRQNCSKSTLVSCSESAVIGTG